jgi:hypothetical protein
MTPIYLDDNVATPLDAAVRATDFIAGKKP